MTWHAHCIRQQLSIVYLWRSFVTTELVALLGLIRRKKNRHGHWFYWMSTGRKNGLSLLELQSRFGYKPLNFQVVCPQLSPKRDWSPKELKCEEHTTYIHTDTKSAEYSHSSPFRYTNHCTANETSEPRKIFSGYSGYRCWYIITTSIAQYK